MKHLRTFESFLFEGKKEEVIDKVVNDIAGTLSDDGEMTKSELEKWLKGAEGKTAIESSLEALDDEYPNGHGVKYNQIEKEVKKKIMATPGVFAD